MHIDAISIWAVFAGTIQRLGDGVVRSERARRKGWNTVLRLYGPLQPWFDKSWRLPDIEPL